MGFYDDSTKLVITRNEAIGAFCIVKPNGSHSSLGFPATMKIGDVAREVAGNNPGKQLGILSECFGPATKRVYGPIVWMKLNFHLN